MNINHKLDDLSLLLIFDRLSVEDLIRAGRVCSRWNFIRRKAALTRHSLKLLIGDTRLALKAIEFSKLHFVLDAVSVKRYIANIIFREDPLALTYPAFEDYRSEENEHQQQPIAEFHQIQFKSFSEFYAQFLFELFPNLHTLTTSLPSTPDDINPMIALLKLLAPLLKTLKLYTYNENINAPTFELMTNKRLLETVNALPSLRVLLFDFKSQLLENEDDRIELPIVGQLEEFYFNTHDNEYLDGSLVDSFNRFGATNARLKDIALTCNIQLLSDEFLDIPRILDKSFTQIDVHFEANVQPAFEVMCSRFINLTTLNIVLYLPLDPFEDEPPFDQFALYRSIAQLKQLVSLELHCESDVIEEELSFHENVKERLEQEIDQLVNPSVKSLSITLFSQLTYHAHLAMLELDRIFPKLQVIVLERLDSTELCEVCAEMKEQITPDHCLTRILNALFGTMAELRAVACPPNVWTRLVELNEQNAEVKEEDEEDDPSDDDDSTSSSSDSEDDSENLVAKEILDDSSDEELMNKSKSYFDYSRLYCK